GGDEGVDARPLGAVESLPGAVDVALGGAGQAGNAGVAHGPGDLAYGLEVAVGGDREAGLDDVDAHLLEHGGDAQLLVQVHGGAGRLLAVAQGGVEDDYAVAVAGTHVANPLFFPWKGLLPTKPSPERRRRSGVPKSQRPFTGN